MFVTAQYSKLTQKTKDKLTVLKTLSALTASSPEKHAQSTKFNKRNTSKLMVSYGANGMISVDMVNHLTGDK